MNKKNNSKLTNLAASLKKNLNRRKNKSKKVANSSNKGIALSLFIALFLTCCQNNIRSHGAVLEKHDIAMLKPHTMSVEDVIEKIGVPTITEANKFLYLNSKFKKVIFFEPKIIKLDCLMLTFNNNILVDVKHQEFSNVHDLNYDNTKVQFAVNRKSIWNYITCDILKSNKNSKIITK